MHLTWKHMQVHFLFLELEDFVCYHFTPTHVVWQLVIEESLNILLLYIYLSTLQFDMMYMLSLCKLGAAGECPLSLINTFNVLSTATQMLMTQGRSFCDPVLLKLFR